ncbi:hypothetical protein [Nonomuraea rubra]|uniref:hypothetical protein n=1 Tax=Nonomuraea rubra TaxID=46180 RepID=UPI0031E75A30
MSPKTRTSTETALPYSSRKARSTLRHAAELRAEDPPGSAVLLADDPLDLRHAYNPEPALR